MLLRRKSYRQTREVFQVPDRDFDKSGIVGKVSSCGVILQIELPVGNQLVSKYSHLKNGKNQKKKPKEQENPSEIVIMKQHMHENKRLWNADDQKT